MDAGMVHQCTTPDGALAMAFHTLAIDQVTVEVTGAFATANIPTILLKGPSIARWLYPAGGRTYVDTDLLVPAEEIPRAQDTLEGLGFEDSFKGFHPVERGIDPVETQFTRRSCSGHMSLDKVDLHRSLPLMPAADRVLWETFLANSEIMPIGGAEVRVLARPALALHIVLHAVQHRFGLHTSEDLRRALEAVPPADWNAVTGLAARLGAEDLLSVGLRHHPGGAALADRLGLPPAAPSSYRWLREGPRGTESLRALRTADGVRAKLQRVRWTLVPSTARIRCVMRCPGAAGCMLAIAYVRWWCGLARSLLPAARFAVGDRDSKRRAARNRRARAK